MGNITKTFFPVFFGIAACSWMPHWACHYYKIETGSAFIVGNLHFSAFDSLLAMSIYSGIIVLNLLAISFSRIRLISALLSGIGHLLLGVVHIFRLINPFDFKVFGYDWSPGASVREAIIVIPFGILCLAMAVITGRNQAQISE